jgi:2-haloacid dehalogenase
MTKIKAMVFDVYGTLFDVHSVQEACEQHFPEKGQSISSVWRSKQLEYAFLRQLMGQYESFAQVTKDALHYSLEKHNCKYSDDIVQNLMQAYNQLQPYEETKGVLQHFQDRKLAVFSNGPHTMLEPLLQHAGLTEYFAAVVSVDEIKEYKPTTAAYTYVLKQLGVKRDEVLFLSSNGWDINGAANFGFHTAWINRNYLPEEKLGQELDKIYHDLNGLKGDW